MATRASRFSIQGLLACHISTGEPIQNHRAQYALIDVEEDGVTNLQFRKVAYDYEGELQDAKDKGLPFIEMYEELRREDNYRGHNIERC